MTGKVLDLHGSAEQDHLAKSISYIWNDWYHAKEGWMSERNELNAYITATDTSTTSNQTLEWTNTTVTPKLTQIRDNLHANYISGLFPNDDWLRWEAYTPDANIKEKKKAIEGYMANKTRRSEFRKLVGQLVLDYIDYGNVFATTDYVHKTKLNDNGDPVVVYSGPVIKRINPMDIVMNPTAPTFEESPIIIRATMTVGEMEKMAEESPRRDEMMAGVNKVKELRNTLHTMSIADQRKYNDYEMDGFGTYIKYLESGHVELLTFMGDYYDKDTDTLHRNKKIIIADRSFVLVNEDIPDWIGRNVYHASWRKRTSNLWGMGPLDNLVGMQYRIDHLENMKANAMDLHIFPPLIVRGNVDEFNWGPMEEIHIDENADVRPLPPDASALQVNFEIQTLMDRMELLAGAPREAMGFRTPGEKTAFEVQQLSSAASRIFQEKVTAFEIELLEPVLNSMLEQARRNLDTLDVVRTMNDDIAVVEFMNITQDDLAGDGILRPVGARHFGEQSIMTQNLVNLVGGPLGAKLAPHLSGKNLAELVEDTLGIERFGLFRPNVGVVEEIETQKLAATGQQEVINNVTVPQE